MAGKSDYLEAKLLDLVLGANAFSAPATVYIALFTAAPSDAGGGTELTGVSNYVRLAVTNNSTNFPNASGTSPTTKSNGTAFTFVTATADWAAGATTIGWVGVFDAATTGNMLYWAAVTVAKNCLNGDTVSFPIGTLTFTED